VSLARNIATVGSATLLSRLLGFFRDVGIAAVLGAGVLSDAYFAALQIPNLFRRLLAEGALNSGFVPIWLRIEDEKGPAAARRYAEEVYGMMLLGLGTFAVLCWLFAPAVVHLLAPGFRSGGDRFPLAVDFIRISAPYIAIAGIVAVSASILNAKGFVGAASFGLVIFNCVFVIPVFVVWYFNFGATAHSGRILTAAIVLAGLGQLILVGIAMLRLKAPPVVPRFSPSPDTRRFFALVVPGVIAGGIPQLKLMAGAMVASSSQASVSWLYYANRLYELPLGVVSIAIASVMVPLIAASVRAQEPSALAASQSRAFEIALGLALPAAAGFALLAEPIAGGLFQRGAFGPRDTVAVAGALAAICAGLPGHVLEKVLGAISFAHEDTRTPMYAALTGLAAASLGALLLFPEFGHVGVAAAIAVSGWVGAVILAVILTRRGWVRLDREVRWRIPLIVIATAAMAVVLHFAQGALEPMWASSATATERSATLVLLVLLGLATYAAILHLTRVLSLRELIASLIGIKA
jgi:putative peptidoglycan lipid II flippase